MSRLIAPALILLALAGAAHAFGLGEGNRFGHLGAFKKNGSSAPSANCILVDVGNNLLADVGNCILVQ